MNYKKTTNSQWIKGKDLVGITKAKIISETSPQQSQFKDFNGDTRLEDVCRIIFNGKEGVYNLALNRATINGLIDAFGEDSKSWMNKELGIELENVKIDNREGIAIYLIPDGYRKIDDENGYPIIIK